MKIGVKTFDSEEFAKHFEDKADFLEIMAVEGKDYSFLKNYKLPIIVHVQHHQFGMNIADKRCDEKNKSSLNFAILMANKLNAEKIILHAGHILDSQCSEENSISFINSLNDKRIIIENIPDGIRDFCSTPENTNSFLKKTKRGFCFDINHAILSALLLKKDYMKMIKDFLKLNPAHYHLGGQNLKKKEQHISLEESDIPIAGIFKLLPKDAWITLETRTDIKSVEKDLYLARELIRSL